MKQLQMGSQRDLSKDADLPYPPSDSGKLHSLMHLNHILGLKDLWKIKD